jgi:phosphoadenosine phosphosulfate reductase
MQLTNFENLDLDATNQQLGVMEATDRIEWAHETFGDGLYSLSSFGVASALMLHLVQKTSVDVPVIAIDTGFWFPETQAFKDELVEQFEFDLHIYGPAPHEVAAVTDTKLWETDLGAYHEVTKLAPLRQAIGRLGVSALLSGVRRQQTSNRANLQYIDLGNDGELRVHPVLDWSDDQESDFFKQEGLPRHPLHDRGYGSVGDYTTTMPGPGRDGRNLSKRECGLHLRTPATV